MSSKECRKTRAHLHRFYARNPETETPQPTQLEGSGAVGGSNDTVLYEDAGRLNAFVAEQEIPELETPIGGGQIWVPEYEELIGDTPLVDLSGMMVNPRCKDVKVLAKCEFFNPGLSIKDRIAHNILSKAERGGLLSKGDTVVAASSGNTGAAIAMMCAMKGYKCVITTSPKCSQEKMDAIRAYGAGLIVSPQGAKEGEPEHYMQIAKRLAAEHDDWFDVNQYDNLDNPEAHALTLGPEIWSQTRGLVTHFVAAASTGGTISGTGSFLRKASNEKVKVILADPVGSIFTTYFKTGKIGKPSKFLVEGVGKGSIPGAMDFGVIDQVVPVTDQQAFDMCNRLARCEGILAGGSSGLNLHAALNIAASLEEPGIVVTVFPDLGLKYLSKIYNERWLLSNKFNAPPSFSSTFEQLQQESREKHETQAWKGTGFGKTPEDEDGDEIQDCSKDPETDGWKSEDDVDEHEVVRICKSPATKYDGQLSCSSFEEMIGHTPLVDLSALVENRYCDKIKLYAKCEFFNPGFSIKDRIVRHIFDKAERTGRLKPGMTVVAASSGNTGASTAMLCAMRGYKCIIATSEKCSVEKQDAIRAYGATLLVSPPGAREGDPNHYMEMAKTLAEQNPDWFDVNQYENKDNPEAHYLTLGPEIFEQTGGTITHFVASGSTGGTITGTAAFLKEVKPGVKCVLADPVGSIFTHYFHTGEICKPKKFLVEGVGKGSIPGTMSFDNIDDVIQVTDKEAFQTCSKLCKQFGVCAGGSAGLNVCAAVRLAESLTEPAVITTVLPDLGIKYLSKIYNQQWLEANNLR